MPEYGVSFSAYVCHADVCNWHEVVKVNVSNRTVSVYTYVQERNKKYRCWKTKLEARSKSPVDENAQRFETDDLCKK